MLPRRLITLAISFGLVVAVGLTRVDHLFAQGQTKDAQPQATGKDAPKPETAPKDAPKVEAAQKDAAKPDAAKPAEPAKGQEPATKEAAKPSEPPPPPVPPEVQAKINAAWKAVAEAIVAAQDAGLVDTSIDPPPILDILIDGRANDKQKLQGTKPFGVSPEVMCAWFTGYGKTEGINYVDDVRIVPPSRGLKQWYDQRAHLLERYMQEVRAAKGPAPKADTKPAAKTEAAPAPPAATPAKPGTEKKAGETEKKG